MAAKSSSQSGLEPGIARFRTAPTCQISRPSDLSLGRNVEKRAALNRLHLSMLARSLIAAGRGVRADGGHSVFLEKDVFAWGGVGWDAKHCLPAGQCHCSSLWGRVGLLPRTSLAARELPTKDEAKVDATSLQVSAYQPTEMGKNELRFFICRFSDLLGCAPVDRGRSEPKRKTVRCARRR